MFRRVSFRLVPKLFSGAQNLTRYQRALTASLLNTKTQKYPASWYKIARFSTTNNAQIHHADAPSQDTLVQYISQINTESWENVMKMLEHVAQSPTGIMDEQKAVEFYNKVAQRFLEREHQNVSPQDVLELGYCFGIRSMGFEEFWEKLSNKFKFYGANKEYSIPEILRFLTGVTNVYTVDEVWESIEKELIRNPMKISPDIASNAIGCIIHNYMRNQNTQVLTMRGEGQGDVTSLDDNQLYNVFKDAAIKQVPEMDKDVLKNVCWNFGNVQHKEEGFWMSAEQRFNEVKSELVGYEFAHFAYCFGKVRQGSPDFWQEMESYVLDTIDRLTPFELSLYTSGFSDAEEGTLKLWNELQKCIINTELPAKELSSIIYALGVYEITNPKTWNHLENQVLTRTKELEIEDLNGIISGLGLISRGEPQLWEAIEERILNLSELPEQSKLSLYITLKQMDKLTPALASFLDSVSTVGDYLLSSQAEGQGNSQDRKNMI